MIDKKVIKFSTTKKISEKESPSVEKPSSQGKDSKEISSQKAVNKRKNLPQNSKNLPTTKPQLDGEDSMSHLVQVEKKIWIWLGKYGRHCLYALLFTCLAWGFYLILKAVNERTTQKYLSEYSQIGSLKDRVTWAEKPLPRSLNNLRGFIFLENANRYTKKEQWQEALDYYQKAKNLLKTSPLKEQSMLGCAYTYLQMQKWNEAEREFITLQQRCPFKFLRAQALYALCYIAHCKGDKKQSERYQKQLKMYDEGAMFLQQLNFITAEH